jgi:hypothetical protein
MLTEQSTTILLIVFAYAAYLLLPSKISFVFSGKNRLQKIQARFGALLLLAVFLNIGLFNVLHSQIVILGGLVNWILVVFSIKNSSLERDDV